MIKPGDTVIIWDDFLATIVEWSHPNIRQGTYVAFVIDNGGYSDTHPHNWADEDDVRKLTKLELALR
jgi:hypothetical protein